MCEPQRQKTYFRTYSPSMDSDQPAHSLSIQNSLIRTTKTDQAVLMRRMICLDCVFMLEGMFSRAAAHFSKPVSLQKCTCARNDKTSPNPDDNYTFKMQICRILGTL